LTPAWHPWVSPLANCDVHQPDINQLMPEAKAHGMQGLTIISLGGKRNISICQTDISHV